MKSLTRLRLINWHFFENTTVPIQNITFLTGDNGTGKSTIVDAIQIIILGSTMSSNFNKAAHEEGKSGRNLISYLRGATGEDISGNVINLRSGVFTSYIATELYDDKENKTITLGVLFDVTGGDNVDKHFFYINSGFPKNDFSSPKNSSGKSRPLSFKEFSSYLSSEYSKEDYKFFATDTEYRLFAKEIFGNLSDNYFSLFKQAVAFKPINNITQFITEFIYDGAVHIDIEPMKRNIEQYKLLQIEAKKLREKKELLEVISNLYNEYSKVIRKRDLYNYLFNRVNYEFAFEKLNSLKSKIEKEKNRLTQISDNISQFDNDLASLNEELQTYQLKIKDPSYSNVSNLILQKDNITSNITTLQMSIESVKSNLVDYFDKYYNGCYHFSYYYDNFDISRLQDERIENNFKEIFDLSKDLVDDINALKTKANNNLLDIQSLQLFKNNTNILNQKVSSLKNQLEDKIYNLNNDLLSLQNEVTSVSSGKKPFDRIDNKIYITIKNELEQRLKARHEDAKVQIFCDLIDVIDPEWQMAIEAVLLSQKFNFFVNRGYYEEANKILKELTLEYNYTNVSIVDSEKLLSANIVPYSDSVALLVESKYEEAQAYVDFLLGKIKKCDTFHEARESGYGLLKDCTGYRNFASWYLRKDKARTFFIGTKISSTTVSSSASDFKEVHALFDLCNELKDKLYNLSILPIISDKELSGYEDVLSNNAKEIDLLQRRINSLDNNIKNVGNSEFSDFNKKVDEIKNKIKEISETRDKLNEEKGSVTNNIQNIYDYEIPNQEKNVQVYLDELNKVDEEIVNNQYQPFFNSLFESKEKSLGSVLSEVSSESTKISSDETTFKNRLIDRRKNYIDRYHVNYDYEKLTSNEEFDKELESISTVKLPEYEQKIEIAHKESIKEFKDDFIYKIRTSIEAVTARINEINEILSKKQFGRDKYLFSVKRSRVYHDYYDMIMDELLLKHGDAEVLFMEKYRNTMNELFNVISSSTSDVPSDQKEEILRNIDIFTSYTTYVDFDLQVIRKIGDEEEKISLGKSIKGQSGGETQTPIYVAILASFASIVRANNEADDNTLRLVIFDEAFSKMDSDRIKNSVDLLREFKLQAVISTPGEKLSDLIDVVDLILVSVRDPRKKKSDLDIYANKGKVNNLFASDNVLVDAITSDINSSDEKPINQEVNEDISSVDNQNLIEDNNLE